MTERREERERELKAVFAKNFRAIVDRATAPHIAEWLRKNDSSILSYGVEVTSSSRDMYWETTYRKTDPKHHDPSLKNKFGFTPEFVLELHGDGKYVAFGANGETIFKSFPVPDLDGVYVHRELKLEEMGNLTEFMKNPHLAHLQREAVLKVTEKDLEIVQQKLKEAYTPSGRILEPESIS